MSSNLVKLSNVAELNPRRPFLERADDVLTSFIPMDAVDEIRGEVARIVTQPYKKVKRGYTYFQNGDVIFAKITPCMQNGKHAVVHDLIDGFGFGSTEFHVVRPSKQIMPEWIHFILRRKETLEAAQKTFTGTVGQQRVPSAFLNNLELPLPSLDVQQRIVNYLKTMLAEVEVARLAARMAGKDAALLRSRLLNEIFESLGDDVTSKILGDHAPTTSGTTPPRGNKRYWEPAEVPWVKTGEVAFAPISRTEEAVSKLALAECSLTLLPPKSVLVAMIGQGKTRGQSALLNIQATTNQNCFAVMPNNTWEPEFLYYWFAANYHKLRTLSADRGGSQSALNGTLINALSLPAPDQAQQLAVIRRAKAALQEVDAFVSSNKATMDELEILPQRLLTHAFEL